MSDGYESDAIPSRRVAKLGRIDTSDIGRGRPGTSERQDDSSLVCVFPLSQITDIQNIPYFVFSGAVGSHLLVRSGSQP